jgi:ubiquinone/menaquinone biosynthesis C-methylase UbiE
MSRWNFYKKNFKNYINKNSNFLLISASLYEVKILKELGYLNFSITYHDEDEKNQFLDFGFKENINLFKSDLRDLTFKDKSFDYTITNATIHHIDLPHKAITELYRVAIKGVLVIESTDSFIMRLATKIKLAEEFEVSSVNEDKNTGGLLDTAIPNYVYRWTEKEVLKLLKSFDPKNINFVNFDYASDLTNFKTRDNYIENIFLKMLIIMGKTFFFFFKKQRNCMSIFIDKTKIKKRWPNKNY